MADKAGYYMVIPASVWADTEIPPNAKLLYGHISTLSNSSGNCTAGNEYFAEQLEISKKRASELIGLLSSKGYIHVEVKKTDKGAVESRTIKIAAEPSEGIPKNKDRVSREIRIGYPENYAAYIKNNNTSNNNTPIVPNGDEERFDTFWKEYPRKVNKPKAKKAWDKLKVTPELFETVMNGLDRWKHSRQWLKDGGEFIPHPSSWLNGRMFEDSPSQAFASAECSVPAPDRGEAW